MKPYPQRGLTVKNAFTTTGIIELAEYLRTCLGLSVTDGVCLEHQFCYRQTLLNASYWQR